MLRQFSKAKSGIENDLMNAMIFEILDFRVEVIDDHSRYIHVVWLQLHGLRFSLNVGQDVGNTKFAGDLEHIRINTSS